MLRLLSFTVWLVLVSFSFRACLADEPKVTKVAVYSDAGAGRSETDLVKALNANQLLEVHRVTAEQIRGGALTGMDVLIHPGGSGSKQGLQLGPEGREVVRSFVKEGGGFIGVCAGAYLASADYDWSLNLLDAKVIDRAHWARGTGTVRVGLSKVGQDFFECNSSTTEIYYGQGPLLAPANRPEIPDYQPLALYETEIAKNGAPMGVMKGTTAIASGEFGRGRVFCFSPHPEKTKGLENFLYRAIAWAANAEEEPSAEEKSRVKWAIVLHGGAGSPPKDASPEKIQAWRDGLKDALNAGKAILEQGGSSLDAVETSIRHLEDNPLFNAGKGAVFNANGTHELDASIMDGKTLDGGAVAIVRTVKNPITLARRVMEKTPHVLLSGEGAEVFADEENVDRVPNDSFSTEDRRKEWEKAKALETKENAGRFSPAEPWHYGTVGCVALDREGNLAAGTSTGGRTNKKFGRVGDSPILGAGTYADNETCGLSATGIGEQFIRHAACAQISHLMRYKNWTLKESAEHVLKNRLEPGDGGVIGIDSQGEIVWVYTSPGMFRAAADAKGRFDVLIRDE
jgi:beta-aspartyl-peptidase (threonine type)